MRLNRRLWTVSIATAVVLGAVPASAQVTVTPADYERAMELRERWEYLTENLADPATWIENTSRFHYRKTVRGGHQFVLVDAETQQKRPAFDHEKLAAALSKVTGTEYTALRLPFNTFQFTDGERSLRLTTTGPGGVGRGESWTCRVSDYTCAVATAGGPAGGRGGGRGGQPRSFGVVRDLEVPADNSPKRSPDGRLEALVQNHNVVVRPVGAGKVTVLSTDGSDANFYDPESIVWSPDSTKLAAYRVRPGYRRLVHYIEPAPADQVQPKHSTQVYVKPGDPVDLDHPVIFHTSPRRQINVPND